jgi:hypothetical protein
LRGDVAYGVIRAPLGRLAGVGARENHASSGCKERVAVEILVGTDERAVASTSVYGGSTSKR